MEERKREWEGEKEQKGRKQKGLPVRKILISRPEKMWSKRAGMLRDIQQLINKDSAQRDHVTVKWPIRRAQRNHTTVNEPIKSVHQPTARPNYQIGKVTYFSHFCHLDVLKWNENKILYYNLLHFSDTFGANIWMTNSFFHNHFCDLHRTK